MPFKVLEGVSTPGHILIITKRNFLLNAADEEEENQKKKSKGEQIQVQK